MKIFNHPKFSIVISIAGPFFVIILFLYLVFSSDRPSENESVYRGALVHYEQTSSSQLPIQLSSENISTLTLDHTPLSQVEIFNDKISIPQSQISYLIKELENEHRSIVKNIDPLTPNYKVITLPLKYRIILSIYLNKFPGDMTDKDLAELDLSQEKQYYFHKLSRHNDFVLLLEKNILTKDYLELQNLKNLYATDLELKRSISSKDID